MKQDIFGESLDVMDNLDSEEMGFLPLLAALAPLAGTLVSSLLPGGGGKSKAAEAPPTAVPPQVASYTDAPTKAELESIVTNLLMTVPPPVRQQVADAIRDNRLVEEGSKQNVEAIVKQISGEFLPQIGTALKALKLSNLQTSATDEHRRIMLENNRWKQATKNQKTIGKNQKMIYKRIQDMERKLSGMRLVSGKRINIFGVR